MKKRMFACLCALLCACALWGTADEAPGLTLEYEQGEQSFYAPKAKKTDAPRYVFSWSRPRVVGGASEFVTASINEYFDMAVDEMIDLTLPMFASEIKEGGTTMLRHEYLVLCNDGRYLGVMTRRESEQDGVRKVSVASQVIDVSGEYAGETLTLRGVVMLGESSDELADMFWQDVYARLNEGRETPIGFDEYAAQFYPAQDFSVNENGDLFFYLQPGVFAGEDEMLTFVYTREECNALYAAYSGI